MSGTESLQNWEVRVEDNTVVVELPEDIKLDQQTGQKINEQFFAATGQTHVESVLTLLRVEEPLSRDCSMRSSAGLIRRQRMESPDGPFMSRRKSREWLSRAISRGSKRRFSKTNSGPATGLVNRRLAFRLPNEARASSPALQKTV
ncbi:hypothetical protein ACFQH8_21300 [Halomicroarcula sp. GCM10025710]